MTDLYENLLRATDNTADITTEKQGTITKIQDKLCSVKEEATGLEHTNVPIINEVQVKEGDTVLLGFLDNNIYNPVVYGVIGRETVDAELSSTSENPVQNKTITTALNGKAGINHTHLSEQILDLIDVIYPVGSIYMSVNDVNPATLFGGEWKQIKDTFLLATGDTYANGSTGGSAKVTLTANQSGLKAHGHGMAHTHNHHHNLNRNFSTGGGGSVSAYITTANRTTEPKYTTYDNTASSKSTTDNNTASNASEAHENMPPYLAVNVWKRIN